MRLILDRREVNQLSKERQHEVASEIAQAMIGKGQIRHTERGRPFVDGFKGDISISHAQRVVFVGAVSGGFRVGVDVEFFGRELHEELFSNGILNEREKRILERVCQQWSIPKKHGLIMFWSIKEALAKCLDIDLIPKRMVIGQISRDGEVLFGDHFWHDYNIKMAKVYRKGDYCYSFVIQSIIKNDYPKRPESDLKS